MIGSQNACFAIGRAVTFVGSAVGADQLARR
jgi:hypothetical protein